MSSDPENKPGVVVSTPAPAAPQPPYHVLMDDHDGDDNGSSPRTRRRMVLDRRLKRDYLAHRYRAFQEAKTSIGTSSSTTVSSEQQQQQQQQTENDDSFWHGATALEKALTGCCSYYYSDDEIPVSNIEQQQQRGGVGNHDKDDDDDDDYYTQLPGALRRDKIVAFCGLVALHCHDVGSRALALAILERTQEADALDEAEAAQPPTPPTVGKKRKRVDDDDEEDEDSTSSPDDDDEESGEVVVECMSPRVVHVQRKQKPPRLRKFVKAGGLRLLCRWLVDASTPVPAPKAPPTKASKQQQQRRPSHPPSSSSPGRSSPTSSTAMVASPTGPLLLPLVLLLQKIPFDRQAITQSQINKKIKRLAKELDNILPMPSSSASDQQQQVGDLEATAALAAEAAAATLTDPVAGGLPVRQVQAALKDTMKTWLESASREQQKSTDVGSGSEQTKTTAVAATIPEEADPFAAVKAQLQDRLRHLEADYNDDEGSTTDDNNSTAPPPEWLVKARAAQRQQNQKSSSSGSSNKAQQQHNKAAMSTKERERQEREQEKAVLLKKDLEKTQRERRELLRKLRALKQNEQAAAEKKGGGEQQQSEKVIPSTRRCVRWKDGFTGGASKMRNREKLERVHVFVKDKDVLAAAAAAEEAGDEFEYNVLAAPDELNATSS